MEFKVGDRIRVAPSVYAQGVGNCTDRRMPTTLACHIIGMHTWAIVSIGKETVAIERLGTDEPKMLTLIRRLLERSFSAQELEKVEEKR